MIKFVNKCDTLKVLKNKVKKSAILPILDFSVSEWTNNQEICLDNIHKKFGFKQKLIIRSCSGKEDSKYFSNAGAFLSIGNISFDEIPKSVEKVINSFKKKKTKNDKIFVQPFLIKPKLSGVITTRDLTSNGHYYVINFDELGNTSAVTSGNFENLKVFYVSKDSKFLLKKEINLIVDAAKELENLFKDDSLDIEFGIDERNTIYLFQVRKLIVKTKSYLSREQHSKFLDLIERKIGSALSRHPRLYGKKNFFGRMPDWNPAEILGIKPNPLSLSLYKELITNNIWAYQRDNYGYKNLRSFPLLIDFIGQPYIDIRVSFNSFLPKNISNHLSEKLVNYYLDLFEKKPYLHDKVEFEIVISCYHFNVKKDLEKLKKSGFTVSEIKSITNCLYELTNKIIEPKGKWMKDICKVKKLILYHDKIKRSKLPLNEKIYWLLEDCKRYGTLPFAGLARAAFIAVQFLNSFVELKIMTKEDLDLFLSSIDTVSSEMMSDFVNLKKSEFVKIYGHLRPGTYDIMSKRYDEAPDYFFNWKKRDISIKKTNVFKFSSAQKKQISEAINKSSLNTNFDELIHFIREAIKWREKGKFIFTKNLSDALKLYAQLGEKEGFSKKDLSYTSITLIKDSMTSSYSIRDLILNSKTKLRKNFEITKQINLPQIISSKKDIWGFEAQINQSNFITQKIVEGDCVVLQKNKNISGKIVLINSADPGYDWIFTNSIKGFITAFGGINSHMSIRASELNIPAVIGIGDEMFTKLSKVNKIKIDCINQNINILS
ncbi:PEP-utilizing enzyme [Alphaproteobacteria bacterium]|nr:PEP-utilizing enzyme [Alphaproteobacteria bacterium]